MHSDIIRKKRRQLLTEQQEKESKFMKSFI